MKNFKNIVALGILAVSTGVSLAEVTYDATAGTGGFADANTDYAASGGSNAKVSADAELSLTVPVKAAISIADKNKNVSSNPLFEGLQSTYGTTDTLEYNRSKQTHGTSSQYFEVGGLIFSSSATNTSFKATTTPFTHVVDSSATVDVYPHSSSSYYNTTYKNKPYVYIRNIGDGTSGAVSGLSGTATITPATFGTDSLATFYTRSYFDAGQLEGLGRIGEFVAVQTIELTCP